MNGVIRIAEALTHNLRSFVRSFCFEFCSFVRLFVCPFVRLFVRFVSIFVEATRTNQNRDPIDCNAGIRHLEVVASLFDKTSFKKVS